MIATVSVRATAGHPNIPLAPIVMFRASAATIGVTDVPRSRCGTDVTGVNIMLTTPDGAVQTVCAKLVCGVWCATFDPVEAVGFSGGGLIVSVVGRDENGVSREWIVGEGDVNVLNPDGAAMPLPVVDVGELEDGSNMKQIREKVNQIVRIIGGTVSLLAVCLSLQAAMPLEDIPGNVNVYTATETDAAISAAVNAAGGVTPSQVGAIASNVVSKSYVESLGVELGLDANAVNALISAATNDIPRIKPYTYQDGWAESASFAIFSDTATHSDSARTDEDGFDFKTFYVKKDELAEVSNTVSAWQTYWDGDDVRVTVTNYYGSTDKPHLYLEQKITDGGTNYWKRIWDETTRLDPITARLAEFGGELANKADRAWGFYDSASGGYSPDGWLQISHGNILIANGLSYQKTITVGGCSIWVLESSGDTMLTGETEKGFFKIEDGDGNALFEIVKGDKRVVGATATGLTMDGTTMVITYNSVSDEHPTLELCADLIDTDWKDESSTDLASVSWGGTSGAWVATVTPIGSRSRMFVKATFEAGGNTYIRNNVATSIDKVVIGGREYSVTVETVNGKQLMVLK